jgi:hypothetical protein
MQLGSPMDLRSSISTSRFLLVIALAGCGGAGQPGSTATEVAPVPRRSEGISRAIAEFETERGPSEAAAPAAIRERHLAREGHARAGKKPRPVADKVARPRVGRASSLDVTRIRDLDRPGGDAILAPGIVRYVMQGHFRDLVPCAVAAGRRGEVTIDFGIRGDGQVGPVAVNGRARGSLQACIRGQMMSIRFPAFDGELTRARFSMTVQ